MLDLEESGVFLCEHCGAFFRNCHDEMFSVVVFEYPLFSPLFVVVSEYFLFSFVVSECPLFSPLFVVVSEYHLFLSPFVVVSEFRFVARQQNTLFSFRSQTTEFRFVARQHGCPWQQRMRKRGDRGVCWFVRFVLLRRPAPVFAPPVKMCKISQRIVVTPKKSARAGGSVIAKKARRQYYPAAITPKLHETHRGKAHPSIWFGRNSGHFSRDAVGKGSSTDVARARKTGILWLNRRDLSGERLFANATRPR